MKAVILLCLLLVSCAFAECDEDKWAEFEACIFYDLPYTGIEILDFTDIESYCDCFSSEWTSDFFTGNGFQEECVDYERDPEEECDFQESCEETWECFQDAFQCFMEYEDEDTIVNWPLCVCIIDFRWCADGWCGITEQITKSYGEGMPCESPTGMAKFFFEAIEEKKISTWIEDRKDKFGFEYSWNDDDTLSVVITDIESAGNVTTQAFCDEFADFFNDELDDDCGWKNWDSCDGIEAYCHRVQLIEDEEDARRAIDDPPAYTVTIVFDASSSVIASVTLLLSVMMVFLF
eukprot:TRINITY_DN11681_c0_g1_i1.p1 TRINITY_DN11681_c0_g1~~TRINITY_DN11681_c0_g1_i1.p1  ORF type:complete len:291 (-),score=86.28 TRINITY_DN11681_c0_g1_i1:43-915(-)